MTLDDGGRVLFTFLQGSAAADSKAGIWQGGGWAVVPSPSGRLMYATSLNNQGWVGARGGFWNGSAIVSLRDELSSDSTVTDVNDAGQATGCRYSPVEPAARALVWTGGVWREIARNDPSSVFGNAASCSVQLNTSGHATVTFSMTGRGYALVWNGVGLSRLETLGGASAVSISGRSCGPKARCTT